MATVKVGNLVRDQDGHRLVPDLSRLLCI